VKPQTETALAPLLLDPEGPVVVAVGGGHGQAAALEAHAPGDRDLADWAGLRRAFGRACRDAGVAAPAAWFDLAEPSCLFPHEEELFRRATGLADSVTISPGGGLLAGAAPVAAGLSRLVASARRLRAGAAHRALAHGAWGPAGQGQAVAILEAASEAAVRR